MAIKFFAFFFDNQYFRMFLVSMADIIGSYDAVRAVAVAKRREYYAFFSHSRVNKACVEPVMFLKEASGSADAGH